MRLLAALLMALPGAAAAFVPPAGCDGVLTVQYRGCLMANYWTCEGDAPGDRWSALFTEDGVTRVRKTDADFQWLETWVMNPPREETMRADPAEPGSLTTLVETGEDIYDFEIDHGDGRVSRYVGFDRLTGTQTEIDGFTLLDTEFGYDVFSGDGILAYRNEGRQYVLPEHNIFLFGTSWYDSDPSETFDNRPVRLIRPGAPGFFPNRPIYDCGVAMSRESILGPDSKGMIE